LRVGCPIRKPTDHGLVTGSPWLIAGSCVLHRLSTPRHPPCALIARSYQPDVATRVTLSSQFTVSSPKEGPDASVALGATGQHIVFALRAALSTSTCSLLSPPGRPSVDPDSACSPRGASASPGPAEKPGGGVMFIRIRLSKSRPEHKSMGSPTGPRTPLGLSGREVGRKFRPYPQSVKLALIRFGHRPARPCPAGHCARLPAIGDDLLKSGLRSGCRPTPPYQPPPPPPPPLPGGGM
jgi:hypothetical protein